MNILVCGTNYGATYLRALSMGDPDLQLAGIMSQGSERSVGYADHLRVPHYTSIEALPDTLDLACVAVPGDVGLTLAMGLMERGIHVLIEHPLDETQVARGLNKAQQHNVCFVVNGHFADLRAAQAFLQGLVTARQQSTVLHYTLSANLRTLYSALDILGRACGDLSKAHVIPDQVEHQKPALFRQLTLDMGESRAALICQNFSSERDDGSANLINHRVDAVFGHGNLLLAESNGPVLWFPSPVALPADQWRSCMPVDLSNPGHAELVQERDLANLKVMKEMLAMIRGEQPATHQTPDYLRHLARLWKDCIHQLTQIYSQKSG